MKYLSVLILLFVQPASAEIKLDAPESCVVGELVRFDATSTKSETLEWKVIPETSDFESIGKKAFFSSRTTGKYLIIVAGSEDNKPVLTTHYIVVGLEADIDYVIKEMLKKVVSVNGKAEALKLAQSFRTNANLPVDKILQATADSNRVALGDSLENWKPFLDGLAKHLDDSKSTNYVITWNAIADSIERHVK